MFNVGDKVRCIGSGGGVDEDKVWKGKVYTVNSIDRDFVSLDEAADPDRRYYKSRFVLHYPVDLPKAKRIAKPKAPARKPGQFLVGDSIIVNSNDYSGSFYPDLTYDQYIGQMLIVTRVRYKEGGYQQVFCGAVAAGFLDSRQIQLALRKDGKPRKLRKKAAPKPKPKAIRFLGKELVNRVANKQSCCHYVVKFTNGELHWAVQAACYASLNYAENMDKGIKSVWEDLSAHHHNHSNKPAYERFVNYILTRSPFKDGFKPVKGVNKKTPWLGAIEWNVDKHGRSYLVTCALALREGSEYPGQLKVWEELVDKGYSEDVAWFIAGFINKTGEKYSLVMTSTHACRHYRMSYKELLKVIQSGLPEYKQEPMAKPKSGQYVIHSNLVNRFDNTDEDKQVYNVFNANIKSTIVGDAWNRKIVMKFEDICLFADKVTLELKEAS